MLNFFKKLLTPVLIVFGIGLIVIFSFSGGQVGKYISLNIFEIKSFEDKIPDEVLLKAESDINKITPFMVNDDMRFDSVIAGDNKISYYYTVFNEQEENLTNISYQSDFSSNIIKKACISSEMETFRDYGVIMEYNYFDVEGSLVYDFDVDLLECN